MLACEIDIRTLTSHQVLDQILDQIFDQLSDLFFALENTVYSSIGIESTVLLGQKKVTH